AGGGAAEELRELCLVRRAEPRVEVRVAVPRRRHRKLEGGRQCPARAKSVPGPAPELCQNRTEITGELADIDPSRGTRQREAVVVSRPIDARAPEVRERAVRPLAEHM